jgi:hypothetical protein
MRTESSRTVPTNLAVLVSTALLACLFASAASAWAQTGENAVLNSAGSPVGSTSFFDANEFTGADVCTKINAALTGRSSTIVVDARGVLTPSTCNMDPFLGISKGSVVLLPAGTITINNNWNPPSQTRIIGVGVPGTGGVGTTLVAGAIPSGMAMIQFPGISTNVGFGVSVEDLAMSGVGNNGVSAIINNFSQEQSYVKHVNFISFNKPVLIIGQSAGTGGAANSGPYENLYIRSATGPCVVLNSNKTRGIHGMTCTGGTSLPAAGVLLDGSNNMIEDVHFEGFKDGILIGSQTGSQPFGDVISVVNGLTTNLNGQMTNVIHISNANAVQDLTLTGIQASANPGQGPAPASIQDDLTSTTLSDATVGLYVLGEPNNGGYSRLTTSPNVPSWSAGSTTIVGSACAVGSLYSNTAATSASTTLYVCVPGTPHPTWVALTIP